jgi:acyl-coenzyme A thioesterase PaaI-like protein
MTHCLFERGIRAVTAELNVRFLDAVGGGEQVTVRAWLESSAHGLHQLAAELTVAEAVKARATAKFMESNE